MMSQNNGATAHHGLTMLLFLCGLSILFMHVNSPLCQHAPVIDQQRSSSSSASAIPSSPLQQHSSSRLECIQTIEDLPVFQQQEDGNLPQVFIVMPAKAGGTSLKQFAIDCATAAAGSSSGQKVTIPNNFMVTKERSQEVLFNTRLHVPKVVASHVERDETLLNLLRHASDNSVIIYVYRDETDRLQSAIRHVVKKRLCFGDKSLFKLDKSLFGIDDETQLNNATHKKSSSCTFDEMPFVEHLIRAGAYEIGISIPSTLTCNVWSEIDSSAPANMLFIHYSQVSQLQTSLSHLYCPQVMSQYINTKSEATANDDADGGMQYWVRMSTTTTNRDENNKTRLVSLEDWLDAKRDTLEYALKLSSGGGCKYKSRSIQDKLQVQLEQQQEGEWSGISNNHKPQGESCPLVRIIPKEGW